MKQFILAFAVIATAAFVDARPKFLVIPMEDVEFVGQQQAIPVVPMYNFRQARSAQEEEAAFQGRPPVAAPGKRPPNRRQDFGEPEASEAGPGIAGSFISALQGAKIPTARDNLASGSNAYASPPQGSDYVDYGAYTGKHGAFGWYTDHPVALFGHGYH